MAKMIQNITFTAFDNFIHYMQGFLYLKLIEERIQMAPHFSSGKISIWFFSKWILGSYKTQTVNFKPMLCRYLHSNMLKTLMFFNIWRKNLKIQKWSSEIMSRLQKFSENNFKWWGLWCWKNHVHISSGYENICIWSSRRLLKTTL